MTYEDRWGKIVRNEEPTIIKFEVSDAHGETKVDCLQDAVKYCDKYDLPYDLIIRLENGVQVSDYGDYGHETLHYTPSFDEQCAELWRKDHESSIKFRVADGKCSTVKTLDTLEDALEFCDKYYLPYGLIIRLENGVQVSDYCEYEWCRKSCRVPDWGTAEFTWDTAPLAHAEVAEERRRTLQEGLDNVAKKLGLPYKTVRLVKLRNRTVVMTLEKKV